MFHITRPFKTLASGQISRPCLEVDLKNPHTDKSISVLALIDTGADECAMPSELAGLLGHNLTKGKPKPIRTGSGVSTAYSHTVDIKIDGFTVSNVLIDFMPNLRTPLLGVKSFLGNFILTINYPKQNFTLLKK
jgi:predicted aspartyl protease